MKKWEYKIIEGNELKKIQMINRAGKKGWRLVNYDFPSISGIVMEREIPESPSLANYNAIDDPRR